MKATFSTKLWDFASNGFLALRKRSKVALQVLFGLKIRSFGCNKLIQNKFDKLIHSGA